MIRIINETRDDSDEQYYSNGINVYHTYAKGHGSPIPSSGQVNYTKQRNFDDDIYSGRNRTQIPGLNREQVEMLKAILDYWTYDIEADGGRDTSDMDERNIRYTKREREDANRLGKLCPPMNINGGMSETTCVNFLKDNRPDLYYAIVDCDDTKERERIFRQIRDAALNGDFKKKF